MALRSISLVSVPVTDQDRAKEFYVDKLGFTVKFDFVMDAAEAGSAGAEARWVMLTPPGGGADITLVTWFGDTTPPGSAKLSVTCDDADATYAELAARGVQPNNEVEEAPWGRWFGVDDPDGNNWLVVQTA
jgi:catechol 2,3-dioxygenase-like lactoylglutathione lyase family enzyme